MMRGRPDRLGVRGAPEDAPAGRFLIGLTFRQGPETRADQDSTNCKKSFRPDAASEGCGMTSLVCASGYEKKADAGATPNLKVALQDSSTISAASSTSTAVTRFHSVERDGTQL